MPDQDNRPIALDVYEEIAESYAAKVDTKAHNAFIDWPAVTSLLPNLNDILVLDVGSGPGRYAEYLLENSAKVVSIDVSSNMLRLARRRVREQSNFIRADIEYNLPFLNSDIFDLVLCPLVLDYIYDWHKTFRRFSELLKKDGLLIFSAGHPFDKAFIRSKREYFLVKRMEYPWSGFGKRVMMQYYHRPLSDMIGALHSSGFIIEELLEPRPIKECKQMDPETYEESNSWPSFICIKARNS
ncbi:MAG: methyltransferase domain-containing protein [Candidatus Lokiarchaeota archaeon]|nr:methyltransferase domain-containing protein [Candidatus Lokiarchaeota archaeon]